jgi:HK97 family phage major capsid protein
MSQTRESWRDKLPASALPRLKKLETEFLALYHKQNENRMTEDDVDRAWAVRGEISDMMRLTQRFERAGNTTGGARAANGQDFDRDSLREPDSIEDGRFRDPWDLRDFRMHGAEPGQVAAELRSRALSAVEKMPGASDAIRSRATSIIQEFDSKDSRLARHALVTSKPAYMRAWSKLMVGKEPAITPDERRALDDVQAFRSISLVDTTGGYLVPFQLEPSLIVVSPFVRSDLRSKARVVVATGDVWNGAQAQNVQYSFQPEGAEATDNSPPFGQPSIPNYMARGFIPISIEALNDMQNVEAEIGRLLVGGRTDIEAVKFIQGSGIAEPTGIVTSLSQSSNSSSVVTSAAAGTFALADLYSLQAALPAHYRAAASWLANNLCYNKIRQFDRAGGAAYWTNVSTDRPPMLFARDALEAEAMSGVVASGNKMLIFGDLQSYCITDRLGTVTQLIPMLPGTHNRPSGQRGFFSWFRTGGDVINPTGLRALSVQ